MCSSSPSGAFVVKVRRHLGHVDEAISSVRSEFGLDGSLVKRGGRYVTKESVSLIAA